MNKEGQPAQTPLVNAQRALRGTVHSGSEAIWGPGSVVGRLGSSGGEAPRNDDEVPCTAATVAGGCGSERKGAARHGLDTGLGSVVQGASAGLASAGKGTAKLTPSLALNTSRIF